VLGHSQLAGSPEIPAWGIPAPQYPSVSLLSWRTGFGNARYWVLKLLIDHFAPGDLLFDTNSSLPLPPDGTNPFCGEIKGDPSYLPIIMACLDDGIMDEIRFADFGTPNGNCPNWKSGKCTCAAKAMAYVQKECYQQNKCYLDPLENLGDPCDGTFKSFAVSATCNTSEGGISYGSDVDSVHALGIISSKDGSKKILLINKTNQNQIVILPITSTQNVMYLVDPFSVQASAEHGIRFQDVNQPSVTLMPFAVGVLVLGDSI